MSSPLFRAHLFGTLTLMRGDSPLPVPTSSGARALLAYLLLHRQQPHPRAVLVGLFWPDMPEDRARRALTQALWQVRRTLPHTVEADADSIHIPPDAPVWVDVAEFEEQVNRSTHEQGDLSTCLPVYLSTAVEIYRGDLLEGIYDDWVLAERERLRETYLQALERLVQLEKSAGSFQRALELALTLTQADPLRETTHRDVMRLYFLLNRPEAALKQFAACRQILNAELALEPEPETVALAQEIAHRTGTSAVPYLPDTLLPATPISLDSARPLQIPLVGRGDERAQLLAHVESIFNGVGGIVLVEGEAGVGKTRLLQEVARDAEWRGAQVLWGSSKEQEAAAPYAPIIHALAQGLSPLRAEQLTRLLDPVWLQVLHPLLPALGVGVSAPASLDPAQERTRLIESLVRLLLAWAQITPLVLLLEDLHWADQDTLDVLAHLARRTSHENAIIVASYRGEEARTQPAIWDKLQALDRSGLRGRLILARLDATATAELIHRSLGLAKSAPLFENRLYRETDGNPLFVLETLRALYDEGLLARDAGGDWRTPWDETTRDYAEMPLPPAVERVIARRVTQLSPPLRETLQAAAILGSHLNFSLLSLVLSGGEGAVGDLETKMALAALGELVQRRFLEETRDAYHFSHDKVRRVVYADVPADARVRLHRRAAEAIQSAHPDQVEALAHHLTEGQVWDRAAQAHERAGEQARAVYAHQAALNHYASALEIAEEHLDRCDDLRFATLAAQEEIFGNLGQAEEQRNTLARLSAIAERLDASHQVEALCRQAAFLNVMDEYAQGSAAAHRALDLAQARGLEEFVTRAYTLLGRIAFHSDRYDEALRFLNQALALHPRPDTHYQIGQVQRVRGDTNAAMRALETALAGFRAAGEPHGELRTLSDMAVTRRIRGDAAEALRLEKEALQVARRIGDRRQEEVLLDNIGVGHWTLREYEPALAAIRDALTLARETEDRRGEVFCLHNLGSLLYELGAHADAQIHLEQALAAAREIGFRRALATNHYSVGRICLERNELDAARTHLEAAREIWNELGSTAGKGHGHLGMGLWHHARGEHAIALEHFRQARELHQAADEVDYADLDLTYEAVTLLELGDLAEADKLSADALARLEAKSGGEDPMTFHLHRARVLRVLGRDEDARAALSRANDLLQQQAATIGDPALRQSFLENVAVNRAIVAGDEGRGMSGVWRVAGDEGRVTSDEESGCERRRVRLPRAGAATGRPLRDDEWIEIIWTTAAPEDETIADRSARRHQRLLRLLREAAAQGAAPTHAQLAGALGVGLRTVERDVAVLQEKLEGIRGRRRHQRA